MRDTLKSKKYFDEFIEEDSKRIEKFVLKLEKRRSTTGACASCKMQNS